MQKEPADAERASQFRFILIKNKLKKYYNS